MIFSHQVIWTNDEIYNKDKTVEPQQTFMLYS